MGRLGPGGRPLAHHAVLKLEPLQAMIGKERLLDPRHAWIFEVGDPGDAVVYPAGRDLDRTPDPGS